MLAHQRRPAGRLPRDRAAPPRACRKRELLCVRAPRRAHEILREVDAVRDRALAAIDAFLDRRLRPADSACFDIAIIGAGMAGASLAAELAPHARGVCCSRPRTQPGYHATGRSAAFWEESYGGPGDRAADHSPRGRTCASTACSARAARSTSRASGDEAAVEAFLARFAGSGVHDRAARPRRAGRARCRACAPAWTLAIARAGLRRHRRRRAAPALPRARASAAGPSCARSARLVAAEREGDGWRLRLRPAGEARAPACWSTPRAPGPTRSRRSPARARSASRRLRRTVAQLRTDPRAARRPAAGARPRAGEFYFKPESGRLWLSPHDETPSAAVRRRARGARRRAGHRPVRAGGRLAGRARSSATGRGCAASPPTGCRSTASIRARDGFFWFAGQGGFGIQTAPAAARLARAAAARTCRATR